MSKLFLLDALALIYRAHFALIARPIFTSKGVNSSALHGFTQTLLQILEQEKPTHLAVVFDTDAPTHRHEEYAEYKSHREAMPEDLRAAIPPVRRMIAALGIALLEKDGAEADDIIGTLAKAAEKAGLETYMVTPDKDFGQLVTERTRIYKPSRSGDGIEILGVKEVLERWGIQSPDQVRDILGLMGDASDNIPGVPGIGEKTAAKLIGQFGTVENLLARTAEVKGKLRETLEANRELAILSKRLTTIHCEADVPLDIEKLKLGEWNLEALRELCSEFEFNSIGKRLLGEDFKAGRGFTKANTESTENTEDTEKAGEGKREEKIEAGPGAGANLKTLREVPHDYKVLRTKQERRGLIESLGKAKRFALAVEGSRPEAREAKVSGLAFSLKANEGWCVELPPEDAANRQVLEEFRELFQNEKAEIIGHDLKEALSVLRWNGVAVRAPLFDTMLAHSLLEPEQRHGLGYLAEALLGRTPLKGAAAGELNLQSREEQAEQCAERADLAWQLAEPLAAQLREKQQEKVFYEIEAELIPVLVEMEFEGIRLDALVLEEFGVELAKLIAEMEKTVYRLADGEFNLNSPKQLGEILFERLKLAEKAKKTKTGQYATNEQVLQELAGEHEIVRRILDYRTASKLKSTYVDTLPGTVFPKTGRIHTTFRQASTSTGRLASDNPNLQNIPIRTELGREIRKAFVPRGTEHVLLSADYSQIELRIIAALAKEPGLIEAFKQNLDIHTATAARVFGVFHDMVTPEMRRKAKMVNYGIAYGISAFGLAQRLGIPRKEAADIIDHYFAQFAGVKRYMAETIEFTRQHGYAETVTGRRRYLRDITSSNATVRGAAERNAINAPIQGSAADMIKIAMCRIHQELLGRGLGTRMLLQVHDELLFDVPLKEVAEVKKLVEEKMRTAIALEVPIVVEMGTGKNWLEAH